MLAWQPKHSRQGCGSAALTEEMKLSHNFLMFLGMGELHLDIYVERMKREYGVEVEVGEPKVNYRCVALQQSLCSCHC